MTSINPHSDDSLNNNHVSSAKNVPEIEDSVCRMCHCESELPNRPLYFPCKCDGSIRYVHQDCLLQWLKVKAKKPGDAKCELCGEVYKFKNIYANGDTPPRLSTFEFIQALVPMFKKATVHLISVSNFLVLWLFGLPILTTIITGYYSSILRGQNYDEVVAILPLFRSTSFLAATWWRGVLHLFFIAAFTLSAFQISTFLLQEYRKLRIEAISARLAALQARLRVLEASGLAAGTPATASTNAPTAESAGPVAVVESSVEADRTGESESRVESLEPRYDPEQRFLVTSSDIVAQEFEISLHRPDALSGIDHEAALVTTRSRDDDFDLTLHPDSVWRDVHDYCAGKDGFDRVDRSLREEVSYDLRSATLAAEGARASVADGHLVAVAYGCSDTGAFDVSLSAEVDPSAEAPAPSREINQLTFPDAIGRLPSVVDPHVRPCNPLADTPNGVSLGTAGPIAPVDALVDELHEAREDLRELDQMHAGLLRAIELEREDGNHDDHADHHADEHALNDQLPPAPDVPFDHGMRDLDLADRGVARDMVRERAAWSFNYENWTYCLLFLVLFLFVIDVIPTVTGRGIIAFFNLDTFIKDTVREAVAAVVDEQATIIKNYSRNTPSIHEFYNIRDTIIFFGQPFHIDLSPIMRDIQSLNVDVDGVLMLYIEAAVGYIFYATILLAILTIAFMRCINSFARVYHMIKNQIISLFTTLTVCIKGTILSYMELILPSTVLGSLFAFITLKTFQTTYADRLEICAEFPLFCMFSVWVIGSAFLYHFTLILNAIRHALRDEYAQLLLPGIQNIDGLLENVLGFYENRPFLYHLHRILLSFVFYIVLFILTILVPIQLGHTFFPFMSDKPLRFRFSRTVSDVEKTVELLVSHLLLPLLVERSQGDFVDKLVKWILTVHVRLLNIGGILNPIIFPWVLNNGGIARPTRGTGDVLPVDTMSIGADDSTNNNNNLPKWYNISIYLDRIPYSVRIMALLLFSAASLTMVYSSALHLPLALGRAIVHSVSGNADHDVYAMCIGVTVCWGLSQIITYIARDLHSHRRAALITFFAVTSKWLFIGIKALLVIAVSLSLPPLLIGVLNEAIFYSPMSVGWTETPVYPLFRCWALGVIYMKGWIKFTLLGMFGDNIWRRKWQRAVDLGILALDPSYILLELIFPIVIICLDYLLTPFFISRLMCLFIYSDSYYQQTIVTRFSFLAYFILRQVFKLLVAGMSHIRALHNSVRDARYLVGTELSNR